MAITIPVGLKLTHSQIQMVLEEFRLVSTLISRDGSAGVAQQYQNLSDKLAEVTMEYQRRGDEIEELKEYAATLEADKAMLLSPKANKSKKDSKKK